MIDSVTPSPASLHPIFSFWLDVGVKVVAMVLGGLWTLWNYIKSRPYAQKLEFQLTGDLFFKNGLYIDVAIVLKNLGASKHTLQSEGTSCDLIIVHDDLSEESVRLFPIFVLNHQIEAGESISDHVVWRIEDPPDDIVWLRFNLRLVSGALEWNKTLMVRVEDKSAG